LKEGVIRNAVNLPTLSAEEYRRVQPYIELGQRLGSFVAQIAAGRMQSVCLRYAGEPSETHTQLIRNASLLGLLNTVLSEKANLVNATALAAERGIQVEERRTTRTSGFPNTVEVSLRTEVPTVSGPGGAREFVVEGTVLPARSVSSSRASAAPGQLREGASGLTPRILAIDGIEIEAPLEGTLLFIRNRDVPGVIGQIGTMLGSRQINIATFALGRRDPGAPGKGANATGADALSVVRVDGPVSESVLAAIRSVPAVTEAHVIQL
jgi:D-3-phosphoglycerate dehydrogenase